MCKDHEQLKHFIFLFYDFLYFEVRIFILFQCAISFSDASMLIFLIRQVLFTAEPQIRLRLL